MEVLEELVIEDQVTDIVEEIPVIEPEIDLSNTTYVGDEVHVNKVPAAKRIGQITGKLRSEERRANGLETKVDKMQTMIQGFIENQNQVAADAKIKELNLQWQEAFNSGNSEEAQRIVNELLQTKNSVAQDQPPIQAQPEAPIKSFEEEQVITSFNQTNGSWYNSNPEMRYSMDYNFQKLETTAGWQDKSFQEKMNEATRLTKKTWSHMFKPITPQSGVGTPQGMPSSLGNYTEDQIRRIGDMRVINPQFKNLSNDAAIKLMREKGIKI